MTKRRGKIIENEVSVLPPLVKGGDDFAYCVSLFLDEMELKNLSYHTMRWHKENLHYVKQTLVKLNLPIEPNKIKEGHFKQCILHWKRGCELVLSPFGNNSIECTVGILQLLITATHTSLLFQP